MSAPRIHRKLKAAALSCVLASAGFAGLAATAAPAHAWGSATVDFTGHGYGHGRGMGQYGAYGYAINYGWTYTQILNHYYGGTTVKTVGLAPMTVDLTGLDGSGSVTVTSGAAFTAGGVAVPAGGAAKLSYQNTNSFTVQTTARGCTGALSAPKAVTSGLISSSVSAPSSVGQLLTACASNRSYRGTLSLTYGGGATRVVNSVSMDDYLRGVVPRESPASWGDSAGGKGMAALQAQAVAARSYAAVSGRYSWARICDSQSCQVYGGAGLNGSSIEDPRTDTAVSSTSTKVLVSNASGLAVSAEYSSSTGGWTAGGTFPAVQDLGDTVSPFHDWTDSVPAATVASTFGVGTLTAITVTRNGLGADGGRVLTATVKGSAGSVTVSGSDFAYELGLRSDWFTVKNPGVPSFILSNSNAAPAINIITPFGQQGDLPLACDFNGDGVDTPAVYRSSIGTFFIRDSFAANSPVRSLRLGAPGDLPVCGDWDGDGVDTVGVYRPSTSMFYLINTNNRTASTPLILVLLGSHGCLPVAGDWTGAHRDTVGVFCTSGAPTFYLVHTLSPGSPRFSYQYGLHGDLPVAGDFSGTGRDSYGVFQAGRRFALTTAPGGKPNYLNYGLPGDLPVVGDWNGDKLTTVGVARGY
jgi:SpoIID/LytB domain protein